MTKSVRALATVVAAMALWNCGGSDGGTEPETPRATTLTVTPATVTLTYIGATVDLTGSIKDQNGASITGTVTWASDDPAVVTVSSAGKVTAVANGTTTVRATSGSASGSASVTVQQAVATLALVAGNEQSAVAGEPLAEAVAVRAQDLGGAGVAGVTVTFTPDEGSGTVSSTTVTTDAEGNASVVWTLGSAFGPQRLTAAAGTASRVFTASSRSPVPLPDLVTGFSLTVTRPDPSTLDTFQVQATVSNDGDAAPEQSVLARLLVDGATFETQDLGAMAPGSEQTVTFELEGLSAGAHDLRFEVDPDEAIEELLESNNVLTKSVPVALETVVSAGATITGINAVTDVELLYRLVLPGAANNLTVELSGGSGDVDLFLEAGERPSNREAYNDCQSGSPTTVERCQLSNVAAGTYHILLHAFTTFSGVTMTISLDGEVLPYNIEVVFVDHGSSTQEAAFIEAAERWMSLITVDVTDSDFSVQPLEADACVEGQPEVSEIIDDIRIYVSIDSIDGPSGTLGQASPCVTRGLGHLPIVGMMQFDSADLVTLETRGDLTEVILHEMGHVLGMGTIWGFTDYLQNPSLPSNSGADTYFNGPQAIAAFDAAGGTSYTGGGKVPVENTAGEGSSDSHWRENVLGKELMTPYLDSGQLNPLSAITVKSLQDLGYQVDASGADPYTGTFTAPSPASGLKRPVLDLSGDVVRRPIVAVDQKGRVVARRQ